MEPFTAMMIMKGAQTFMSHQAQRAKANEFNAWKYKKDLAIKKQLETRAGFARQAIADTAKMRIRQGDIKSEGLMESTLNQMKVAASVKASGLAQGQSTDGLLRQAQNTVLKGVHKLLKDLEMKAAQLDYRDREIQQGMEMAWLNAKAQIEGSSYQSGPGMGELVIGMGMAAGEAYTYDQQIQASRARGGA